MKTIEFNDELATRYAKKIFGFAYSKTYNTQHAEDLAQEILCSLTDSLRKQSEIADLDGFIYTVSNFTWSKFLRKNKRHWNNLDVDALLDLQSGQDVEAEAVNSVLVEKMRAEVQYLTELHRKITLMFYYDNKTSGEIAEILKIPHSTIRWHLTESKKKLKAGIEMGGNTNYEPRRLWCGINGQAYDADMRGLGSNPLVDNIALVCYGRAMTIEEISRTLQVAAFYTEPHIEQLVYMDYLRVKDKNKYSTNFYISTANFRMEEAKYKLHNISAYSENIIGVHRKYIDEIKSIGFAGSDLDEDFLLWAFIPVALENLYYQSLGHVLKQNKISIDTPKRKDGSQHWAIAGLRDDTHDINRFTKEEVDFCNKSNGNGIKRRGCGVDSTGTSVNSLQYDSYATIKIGINWREFGSNEDLLGLKRIATIIKDDIPPNEHDKEIIAAFAEQGYGKMENGKPKLLIPFLFSDEWGKYNEIWQKIHHEIGQNIFAEFIEGFAAIIEKEIPSFISKDERNFLKYKAYPQYAVLYFGADNGLIRYPTDEEARRLSTIVWCE